MPSPERREGRPRSGGSPEARRAARLLRRRRGWTWTAAGSLAGLVMYVILGVNFFGNLTGAANVISAVPVLVLLGLIPSGLIAAVADTVRLHRLEAVIRAGVPGGTLDGILPRPSRHQGSAIRQWFDNAIRCEDSALNCGGTPEFLPVRRKINLAFFGDMFLNQPSAA